MPAAAITSPAVTVPVSIEEHRAAILQRRGEAERLGDDIAELAARIQAATYELLVMIRAFDEREGWSGFKSCAHWLNWRTGLALGAAREKVRVARALGDLPLLSEAMQRGRISYSKVRALTRVATPANENRLLDFALCAPASYVERLARAWQRVDLQAEAADEQRRHERRNLTTWVDDDGNVVIRGRLSPEVGAILRRALEAAGDRLRTDVAPEEAAETSFGQRPADALGLIAESALAADLDRGTAGDRYQVVLHVEAETLRTDTPECAQNVSAETFCEEASHPAALDGALGVSAETSPRPTAPVGLPDEDIAPAAVTSSLRTGGHAALEDADGLRVPHGDRPPDGLRRRKSPYAAWGGRCDPRRRAQDPHHPAGSAAGAAGAGSSVPVSRLQRPALRCPPRPALGRRGCDAARQPGPALPPAPSGRSRGGLHGADEFVRRRRLLLARRQAVP